MTHLRIYKLVSRSIRRPSVSLENAHPRGYFKDNFNGHPLTEDWVSPPHFIRGTSYKPSDCVSSSMPGPLFSERAVKILNDVAPNCAEYKFFTMIGGKPYFVMNVLAAEDILDEAASEVTRSESGEIVTVVKFAFRDLPARPLFKLPRRFSSDTLCTEAIPEAVVEHKLTGFGFWDPTNSVRCNLFVRRQ